MKLLCKNCGAPVPARSINVQTMTAVCENCDSVFTFDPSELVGAGKRRKIEKPESFDVQEDANSLHIAFIWRQNIGPLERFLLALFMALGSVTGFAATAGLNELAQGFDTGALIGTTLMLAATLFLAYMVLIILFNHTDIHVDDDRLTVRHHPLYWPGMSVPVDNIDRIETESIENLPNYHYLRVIEPNGTQRTIDNFQVAQAQYLKHRMERFIFSEPEAADTNRLELIEPADEIIMNSEGELLLPEDNESTARV